MFSLWMYDINKGNRSLGTAFQIFHDIYLTTEKNSKSKLGRMSYLGSLREIQRVFFDHRGVVKLLDIITKAYFRDSQRYIGFIIKTRKFYYSFHYTELQSTVNSYFLDLFSPVIIVLGFLLEFFEPPWWMTVYNYEIHLLSVDSMYPWMRSELTFTHILN